MDSKLIYSVLFVLVWLWSSVAICSSNFFSALAAFQGGYASLNANNNTQTYLGSDNNTFIYKPLNSAQNSGFYGVFVGGEKEVSLFNKCNFIFQAGVEYNNFGQININGTNLVGVDANSYTEYSYAYRVKSQQALAGIKFISNYFERLNPYGETSIGIAFNHAGNYTANTSETSDLNITPDFNSQSITKFSYIFGAGLNLKVNAYINVGLGYRYSFLGTSKLGNGIVSNGTTLIPVAFNALTPNMFTNQLLARASYTI